MTSMELQAKREAALKALTDYRDGLATYLKRDLHINEVRDVADMLVQVSTALQNLKRD